MSQNASPFLGSALLPLTLCILGFSCRLFGRGQKQEKADKLWGMRTPLLLLALTSLVLVSQAWASNPYEVPNSFTAGTVISAAKVNENFAALAGRYSFFLTAAGGVSQTVAIPAGATQVIVEAVGGGGGGGMGAKTAGSSAGGGAGGNGLYVKGFFALTSATSLVVTVGTGGLPGPCDSSCPILATANFGNDGLATTVSGGGSVSLVAPPGLGGGPANSTGSPCSFTGATGTANATAAVGALIVIPNSSNPALAHSGAGGTGGAAPTTPGTCNSGTAGKNGFALLTFQ